MTLKRSVALYSRVMYVLLLKYDFIIEEEEF